MTLFTNKIFECNIMKDSNLNHNSTWIIILSFNDDFILFLISNVNINYFDNESDKKYCYWWLCVVYPLEWFAHFDCIKTLFSVHYDQRILTSFGRIFIGSCWHNTRLMQHCTVCTRTTQANNKILLWLNQNQ